MDFENLPLNENNQSAINNVTLDRNSSIMQQNNITQTTSPAKYQVTGGFPKEQPPIAKYSNKNEID